MKNGSLLTANIKFLMQGVELLRDIDDDQYLHHDSPYYKSSVGTHMRHILDHYLSLVEHKGNKIDYDNRQRNERIETDREYALSLAERISDQLAAFRESPTVLDKKIKVKSNEAAEGDGDLNPWSDSTIKRELQFLLSHTVHHYALIAVILRIQGVQPTEDFGVAPSTLQYRERQFNSGSDT